MAFNTYNLELLRFRTISSSDDIDWRALVESRILPLLNVHRYRGGDIFSSLKVGSPNSCSESAGHYALILPLLLQVESLRCRISITQWLYSKGRGHGFNLLGDYGQQKAHRNRCPNSRMAFFSSRKVRGFDSSDIQCSRAYARL